MTRIANLASPSDDTSPQASPSTAARLAVFHFTGASKVTCEFPSFSTDPSAAAAPATPTRLRPRSMTPGSPATPRAATSPPATQAPQTPLPSVEAADVADDESGGAGTPSFTFSPPPTGQSFWATPEGSSRQQSPSVVEGLGALRIGSQTPPRTPSVARALAGMGLASPGASPSSRLPAHRVEDEELPAHRFHAPEVQKALADGRAIMRRLADVLGSGLPADAAPLLRRCRDEAEELARFEVAATRTVGFVGDSGAGKSSLLNCLLDVKDLARTSGAGVACTCVATEYHYHDRDDFVIAVECFTRAEVAEQMGDLLTAYRQHHAAGGQDDEHGEWLKKRADLAESTFKTIFRARRTDKEFLCGRTSREVLDDLLRWAEDAYPTYTGETLPSSRACSDALERLTSQDARDQSATWPFIRRVKVFLRSHVLRNGLVLVDLPGLRDVNAARVAVTERQLHACDEVFAVARIDRATSDAGVVSVFDYAAKANLSNVGIVCTKSDEIEAHEAERDGPASRRKEVRRLRQKADELRQRLKQADESEDDSADALSRYRDLRRRSKAADAELKKYLVETRNDKVTADLVEGFKDQVGGSVRVFCVSNKMYRDRREGPRDPAADWLGLSGIISLRRHCLSLTADSQLSSLATYVEDAVPGLLGRVGLWVRAGEESADAEEKAAVREALDRAEREIREALQGGRSPLANLYERITALYEDEVNRVRNTAAWAEAAQEACWEWRAMLHPTFKAFCANHGAHQTKSQPWRNWNQEAVQPVADDVDAAWDGWVRESRRDGLDAIVSRLKKAVNLHGTELDTLLEGTAQLNHLRESVRSYRHMAEGRMKRIWADFARAVAAIHTEAFTGVSSSMMVSALKPAYRECNRDYGSGSDARRKQTMATAVASRDLFESLMSDAECRVWLLALNLQRDLNEVGAEMLRGVGETMDLVRENNAAVEGDRDPAFRKRVDEAAAAAAAKMAAVRQVVLR